MTASTPSRSSAAADRPAPQADRPQPKSNAGARTGARAALRKLLGRDRDKARKADPNIYPLF